MTQTAAYYAIEIVANLQAELVLIRLHCKLLNIRRPVVFGTLTILLMCLSFFLKGTSLMSLANAAIISITTSFVLPIAMSGRDLRSSILRTLYVLVTAPIAESAAALTYGSLTGAGLFPASPSESLPGMAVGYTVGNIAMTLSAEMLLMLFNRHENPGDIGLQWHTVFLCAGSYLFFMFLEHRMIVTSSDNPMAPVVVLVGSIATVVVVFAALEVARQDLQASQRNADQAARTRRTRHIRAEVAGITRSSVGVRRLRHDMANQVGVIDELVSEGRCTEAEDYLAALQEQADKLSGRTCEAMEG